MSPETSTKHSQYHPISYPQETLKSVDRSTKVFDRAVLYKYGRKFKMCIAVICHMCIVYLPVFTYITYNCGDFLLVNVGINSPYWSMEYLGMLHIRWVDSGPERRLCTRWAACWWGCTNLDTTSEVSETWGQDGQHNYLLVNVYISMENHHFIAG